MYFFRVLSSLTYFSVYASIVVFPLTLGCESHLTFPLEKAHSAVTLSFPSFYYSTLEVVQVKGRDAIQ